MRVRYFDVGFWDEFYKFRTRNWNEATALVLIPALKHSLSNLVRLSVMVTAQSLPWLNMLLGPKLTSLSLGFWDNNDGISLFPILSTNTMSIKNIKIWGCAPRESNLLDERAKGFSEYVCTLTDLVCLTTMGSILKREAILHLASIKILSKLRLVLPADYDQSTISLWFPALTILTVCFETNISSIRFFQTIAAPGLLSLTATFPTNESQLLYTSTFSALAASFSKSLLNLEIVSDHQVQTTTQELLHLSPLDNLTRVHLRCPKVLDDDFLRTITIMWPKLVYLNLSSREADRPLASLIGMCHLVQKCQNLACLHISIDGTVVPPLVTAPQFAYAPNTVFDKLVLYAAPINNAAEVAAVLSLIMPNLASISTYSMGSETTADFKSRWLEVVSMIRLFVEAREQWVTLTRQ